LESARDVVLHGFLGEVKPLPDLVVRLALGDQREDSLLLRGKAGQLLVLHEVLASSRRRDG
jgi:hypothetical protein